MLLKYTTVSCILLLTGGQMNPEVPEREPSPVPRRRWKPLDEPDRRMDQPGMSYQMSVPGTEFAMEFGAGAH